MYGSEPGANKSEQNDGVRTKRSATRAAGNIPPTEQECARWCLGAIGVLPAAPSNEGDGTTSTSACGEMIKVDQNR